MGKTPGHTMFGAAYVSTAAEGLTSAQVASLVDRSGRRNGADLLSGFLLRAGRNFVQYLEGPEARVRACLRRIESDRRHHDMKIVAVSLLEFRRFPGWSMAYFVGDSGGTIRLEHALTRWVGTDRALLEEVWRIGAIAHSSATGCDAIVHGPFDVLLNRSALRE